MSRLPGAMVVVDIKKESIAVKEAKRLNIPVYAIVDTNCDPDPINYIIPANDDAVKTVELIINYLATAIIEGEAKAKELKAQEAAENERQKKEQEQELKEEGKKETTRKFEDKKEKKAKEENTSAE